MFTKEGVVGSTIRDGVNAELGFIAVFYSAGEGAVYSEVRWAMKAVVFSEVGGDFWSKDSDDGGGPSFTA